MHTTNELRLFVLWFDFVESKKQRVCAKTSVYRNIYAHTWWKELRLLLFFDLTSSNQRNKEVCAIKIIKGCADRCVKCVSVRERNVKLFLSSLFFSVFYFVIDIFTYFIFKRFLSFFNYLIGRKKLWTNKKNRIKKY